MPTAHVRLKPIEWLQGIRHYPQQGGEGRYLGATCTYTDDSNLRLSTGAKLSEFLMMERSASTPLFPACHGKTAARSRARAVCHRSVRVVGIPAIWLSIHRISYGA